MNSFRCCFVWIFSWIFFIFPTVCLGAISQFVFITKPQTIAPNTLSKVLTVQAEQAGAEAKISSTAHMTINSDSPTGQFFSNTSEKILKQPVAMRKNTANKNFYYKDSASGTHTIRVSVTDGGTQFETSQAITVTGPANSGTATGGGSTKKSGTKTGSTTKKKTAKKSSTKTAKKKTAANPPVIPVAPVSNPPDNSSQIPQNDPISYPGPVVSPPPPENNAPVSSPTPADNPPSAQNTTPVSNTNNDTQNITPVVTSPPPVTDNQNNTEIPPSAPIQNSSPEATSSDIALLQITPGPDKTVPVGTNLVFQASSTQSDISYQWIFGDGGTDTGLVVHHTYSAIGNYELTLIAQSGGSETSAKTTIHVFQPDLSVHVAPAPDANQEAAPVVTRPRRRSSVQPVHVQPIQTVATSSPGLFEQIIDFLRKFFTES